ncbi:MAG: MBL fold metallo-hydrolase [Deltaproteobacteria bacterium]|nr:MAG: MBL fold metallo-hydrolase [Deltaproteobacteria bacterium]
MRKSVSAIFTHRDKLFYMTRQNYLSVFPGYTAFPGGKVDKSDSNKSINNELVRTFEPALIHALSRECQEELNFDLIGALEFGDILDIKMIGIAVTPEFNPYRFENYYFKIELDSEIDFNVDDNEAAEAGWISPDQLLARYDNAEIMAVPPTVGIIRTLADDIKYKGELKLTLPHDPETEVPMIESIKGVRQFLPLSNTFPPANRTNCFLIGDDREGVLVDPSPRDEIEKSKLLKSLRHFIVDEIFITHHHPDHHEFAVDMARTLDVPMGMGKWTYERIKKLWGEDYFHDRKIKFYEEGDVLTTSLGKKVLVYEVPGHDEGQLALAPETMSWFLVGDLIQTVGTVVIGGEEGDMAKYFTSLQKVIDHNPRFIIPSHGIALGGTNKLSMTLKHRMMREEQIAKLHAEGKTKQQMLEIVYEGLDKALQKYAMKTIEAHLKKLGLEIE